MNKTKLHHLLNEIQVTLPFSDYKKKKSSQFLCNKSFLNKTNKSNIENEFIDSVNIGGSQEGQRRKYI